MSRCDACPIRDGECFGERHAFACKFALDDANPTQRRFLIDQSAILQASPPAEVVPAPAEALAYPSKLQMAANLITAAVDFVASGCEVVDREEYDRRRAICKACPSGLYVAREDACLACGCNMRAKSRGAAWKCEKGHWEKGE